jgi:hypothetical protein
VAAETIYSVPFWMRATELAAKSEKECEQCHCVATAFGKYRREVRVAFRVGYLATPENLGLFCTLCRRVAERPKFPRKKAAEFVGCLFE